MSSLDEINGGYSEFNLLPCGEQNAKEYVNENVYLSKHEENTRVKIAEKKTSPRALSIKLATFFVTLCACVASIQTGIYIPVFSEIFSPTPKVTNTYISTLTFNYLTDATYRYLDIKITPDKTLDFNGVYVELYNLTLDTKYSEYSILYKSNIDTSWARIPFKLTDPVYNYEIRLYCSTDHPEKIEYSSSFVKDEITYYLIYTYDKTVTY